MTADGMTAWDACCHCYGGGDSQQFDSNDDADVGCSLVEGWSKYIFFAIWIAPKEGR